MGLEDYYNGFGGLLQWEGKKGTVLHFTLLLVSFCYMK